MVFSVFFTPNSRQPVRLFFKRTIDILSSMLYEYWVSQKLTKRDLPS